MVFLFSPWEVPPLLGDHVSHTKECCFLVPSHDKALMFFFTIALVGTWNFIVVVDN
jgi:hypothetical protein